jgi:hypothetical protein
MPIQRDLSHLPRDEGGERIPRPPDNEPRFVTALAQHWWDEFQNEDENRSARLENWYWASDSGKECMRALHYAFAGTPASDPFTVAGAWRMRLGTLVHKLLDQAMLDAFKEGNVHVYPELRVDLRDEVYGVARIDLVIDEDVEKSDVHGLWIDYNNRYSRGMLDEMPGSITMLSPEEDEDTERMYWQLFPDPKVFVHRTVVELKTVTGFPFKLATTSFKGPPTGPRHSAIVQGAMAAHALHAHELVIGNLAMENLSPGMAKWQGVGDSARFAAEWTFPRDQYEGYAKVERDRIQVVLDYRATDKLSPRTIVNDELPVGNRVTDPSKGTWQRAMKDTEGELHILEAGRTWHCDYCPHRAQCIIDGPS